MERLSQLGSGQRYLPSLRAPPCRFPINDFPSSTEAPNNERGSHKNIIERLMLATDYNISAAGVFHVCSESVSVCVHVHMHTPLIRGHAGGICSLLPLCGFRDRTQRARLGGEHLYPPSHLTHKYFQLRV